MFCDALPCFRLNYNLDVADRLADEHALIGLYVNLLQNNPKSWLVSVVGTVCWASTATSQSFPEPNLILSVLQH